jgi:hypothetical protein
VVGSLECLYPIGNDCPDSGLLDSGLRHLSSDSNTLRRASYESGLQAKAHHAAEKEFFGPSRSSRLVGEQAAAGAPCMVYAKEYERDWYAEHVKLQRGGMRCIALGTSPFALPTKETPSCSSARASSASGVATYLTEKFSEKKPRISLSPSRKQASDLAALNASRTRGDAGPLCLWLRSVVRHDNEMPRNAHVRLEDDGARGVSSSSCNEGCPKPHRDGRDSARDRPARGAPYREGRRTLLCSFYQNFSRRHRDNSRQRHNNKANNIRGRRTTGTSACP